MLSAYAGGLEEVEGAGGGGEESEAGYSDELIENSFTFGPPKTCPRPFPIPRPAIECLRLRGGIHGYVYKELGLEIRNVFRRGEEVQEVV